MGCDARWRLSKNFKYIFFLSMRDNFEASTNLAHLNFLGNINIKDKLFDGSDLHSCKWSKKKKTHLFLLMSKTIRAQDIHFGHFGKYERNWAHLMDLASIFVNIKDNQESLISFQYILLKCVHCQIWMGRLITLLHNNLSRKLGEIHLVSHIPIKHDN